MNLVDIAYPRGTMDSAERAEIAQSIVSGLLGNQPAPEQTMKRARAMMHVTFHERESWTTGDGLVPSESPQPIIVTMTVPEAWRTEMSRHGIGAIRAALNRYDASREGSRPGGEVWINVVGIADGSIGLNGKPSTADDVLDYMTEEFRAHGAAASDLPDGVLIDPICGMQVRLGRSAITLEQDGTTMGFCALGCRDSYARKRGIEVPATPGQG